MADEEVKIAVASSDGIVVNNHFGRAKTFYIYKVKDNNAELIEKRELEPVCEMGNHDEDRLKDNLEKLKDCDYLLVSRIGDGARAAALGAGIESFEIPGIIEKSIDQLIKYIKIQKLFE
jgi:predicted Fe-Mo cluster-binding NifX family protein